MKYKYKVEFLESMLDSGDIIKLLDGFEQALVGYNYGGTEVHPIYDVDKCIKIIRSRSDMNEQEAYEYFDYNVVSSVNIQEKNSIIFIKKF